MAEEQEYSSAIYFEYIRILADQNNLMKREIHSSNFRPSLTSLTIKNYSQFSWQKSNGARFRKLLVQEKEIPFLTTKL